MPIAIFVLAISIMSQPASIVLRNGVWTPLPSATFFHATDGTPADYPTQVQLMADQDYLHVSFVCEKDAFVDHNDYTVHNQALYNQEVFEVFIAPGTADPDHYLELEINPNNALWIGHISNPSRGEKNDLKATMVDPARSGIQHYANKGEHAWSGRLSIPWALISPTASTQFRLNFYRIVATKAPEGPNWACNTDNCAFLCWTPTLSGKAPAFHRPRRFGMLEVQP